MTAGSCPCHAATAVGDSPASSATDTDGCRTSAEVRALAAAAEVDAVAVGRFGRAPQSWNTRAVGGHLPGYLRDCARQYVLERWYPSPGRDLGGRTLAYFDGRWYRWDGGQWVAPSSPTARPGDYDDPVGDDIAEWIGDAQVWDGDQLVPWRQVFNLDSLIHAVREVCAVPVGVDGQPANPIGVCDYDQQQARREATSVRAPRPLRLKAGNRG